MTFTLAELQKRAAKAVVAKQKAKDNPRENKIESEVKDYARSRGWWVRKFKSPGNRSAPDDIFGQNGRVFWIEFKRKDKPPTADQALEHEEMRKKGLTVYVVDNIEDGKRIIDAESEWV